MHLTKLNCCFAHSGTLGLPWSSEEIKNFCCPVKSKLQLNPMGLSSFTGMGKLLVVILM